MASLHRDDGRFARADGIAIRLDLVTRLRPTIIVRTKSESMLGMAGMLKAPRGKQVSVDAVNPWR